jgi:23S rRNA (guanine2445-N2)-methyltransferase / 23S rRNA (guanine2069-N7)-methyltransferase
MPTFFAICPRGLEDLLADELADMGAEDTRPTNSGVHFDGPISMAYRAILWSRLANGVLYPLSTFPAADDRALYGGVRSVLWDEHFTVEETFSITYNSTRSKLDHSHFAIQRAKDAIVDQFRSRYDARPSIDTARPDIALNVYNDNDVATLSIDLAGPSLHRRGYRDSTVSAPLKENVAASMLYRAGWPERARQGEPLLDPFCGSGTILIEGAMIAGDIAPGLYREEFGFERWKQHDSEVWAELLKEARDRADAGWDAIPPIYGFDLDPKAIKATRDNVSAAELEGKVQVGRRNVASLVCPSPTPGLVATNAPYGERVNKEDALEVHQALGDRLIEDFMGWSAAILTGSKDLGFALGMRATKVNKVDNGPIRALLLQFDIEESRVHRERLDSD